MHNKLLLGTLLKDTQLDFSHFFSPISVVCLSDSCSVCDCRCVSACAVVSAVFVRLVFFVFLLLFVLPVMTVVVAPPLGFTFIAAAAAAVAV